MTDMRLMADPYSRRRLQRVWLDGVEVDDPLLVNAAQGWLLTERPIPGKYAELDKFGRLYTYYGVIRIEHLTRWEGTLSSVRFDTRYIEIEIDTGKRGREWRFQAAAFGRLSRHDRWMEHREHLIMSIGTPVVIERTFGEGPPLSPDGAHADDFKVTVNGVVF